MFRRVNLTIQNQIIILSGFLLALQLLIGVISYYEFQGLNNELNTVYSKVLPSIDNLVQGDRDFQQSLVAERTLLFNQIDANDRESQIKDYIKNRNQVIERFEKYAQLTTNPDELKIINDFRRDYNKWAEVSDEKVNFKTLSKTDEDYSKFIKISTGELAQLFENSRNHLDMLQEIILTNSSNNFKESQENLHRVEVLIVGILISSIILTITLCLIFISRIKIKVRRNIEKVLKSNNELHSVSVELTDKSSQLSESATEQNSAIQESVAAIDEISSMISRSNENSQESASVLKSIQAKTKEGSVIMNKMSDSISSIEDITSELNNIVSIINAISEKTNIINEIVFNTQLLSFNASIEAARAGQHGKGFSVVATEVGNLAQVSGNAAKEIRDLLDDSHKKVTEIVDATKIRVEGGKEVSQSAILTFDSIANNMNQISERVNSIVAASQEQALGIKQSSSAMNELEITAKRNESIATETSNLSVGIENAVDDISSATADMLSDILGEKSA